MIDPDFHDGTVESLDVSGDDYAEIRLRTVSGIQYRANLHGLKYLRCDDFREGNIILDCSVFSNAMPPEGVLRRLFDLNPQDDAEHLRTVARSVSNGDLALLSISPSYGCELTALSESVEFREVRERVTGKPIVDPATFFRELGGLHDTEIVRIDFDPHARSLAIKLEDLNANFVDLPEDPGRRSCTIHFVDVSKFHVDVDVSVDLAIRIDGIDVRQEGTGYRMKMSINLGCGPLTGNCPGIAVDFEGLHLQGH